MEKGPVLSGPILDQMEARVLAYVAAAPKVGYEVQECRARRYSAYSRRRSTERPLVTGQGGSGVSEQRWFGQEGNR